MCFVDSERKVIRWTGCSGGHHFSEVVFCVCHDPYVLYKYPEVWKKYVFVNLFCIAGMTYIFLFSLGWWQETQPGSWKWGERNLDVRHLETNFTLVRHGLLAIFFPLGMLLIFMLWWKSEMPRKTHMLKDSLPASGFVGRNGLMRALEFYGVIRRKWKL